MRLNYVNEFNYGVTPSDCRARVGHWYPHSYGSIQPAVCGGVSILSRVYIPGIAAYHYEPQDLCSVGKPNVATTSPTAGKQRNEAGWCSLWGRCFDNFTVHTPFPNFLCRKTTPHEGGPQGIIPWGRTTQRWIQYSCRYWPLLSTYLLMIYLPYFNVFLYQSYTIAGMGASINDVRRNRWFSPWNNDI